VTGSRLRPGKGCQRDKRSRPDGLTHLNWGERQKVKNIGVLKGGATEKVAGQGRREECCRRREERNSIHGTRGDRSVGPRSQGRR